MMFLYSNFCLIRRPFSSNVLSLKRFARLFSTSRTAMQIDEEFEEEETDSLLEDSSYHKEFSDIPLRNAGGHSVLALQPELKNVPKSKRITTGELQLSELCALTESITNWEVVQKSLVSLKRICKEEFFTKGKLEEVTEIVKEAAPKITAIVFGIDTLNSQQLSFLQKLWKIPIYDRYTLVLEIFRKRATTNEAKLQVSLAEIYYLRMHLYGIHSDSLDFQKDGLQYVGGLAERTFATRRTLLRSREVKILKLLDKVKGTRATARENRKKLDIPVVAIVGYTNAGKTSLIKSLTGISTITPMNRLFATLDVATFQGHLPNRTKVLYLDTVGFISDIPDSLMNAFSVTLADVARADLLVHVSDVSHPDRKAQDVIVDRTLSKILSLPQGLLDNMIRVYNKSDLVEEHEIRELVNGDDPKKMAISVKEGWGQQELLLQIQESIMNATGRVMKRLKVPAGGAMLTWLYKEAAVEEVIPDENDPGMYLVKAVMTVPTLAKFNSVFRPKKK